MAGLSGSHGMFAESFNALSTCHGGIAEWPTLEAASPNPNGVDFRNPTGERGT